MSTTLTGTDVAELSAAALDSTPRDHSWDSETWLDLADPESGGWDYAEAVRCDTCERVIVDYDDHAEDCEHAETDAREMGAEGPMMNYWYPCGLDLPHAARVLVNLPLVPVVVEGETGLALSGGGMNLSWEICEAFILLGYLPPLHFTDLPGMAGRGQNEADKVIVAACQRSNQLAADHAQRRIARLAAI